MSTPRSSKSIHSLLSPLSRSAWSLPSTRMRSFSACLTVLPRFFSILPISSFSFFAEKSLPSDFAVSMLSSISRLTPFEILLTAFWTDVHALERVLPDDDRVPVAGGDFGPEACRALAGAVGLRHGQDVRVRVERQIVLRPLFGQMVRYDDHRLGGPAESFRLVAGGHAR